MIHQAQQFLHTNRGATAIEYAMICAMIILVIIGGITALGSAVSSTLYDQIAAAL